MNNPSQDNTKEEEESKSSIEKHKRKISEESSKLKMRIKEITNQNDIIEKLKNYLEYISGLKNNPSDLFNNRNLLTLIDYRESKDALVRKLSIMVLSQFLLAKENILEIVKEKSFFKFRYQIFLNNFDSFDFKIRRLLLENIIENSVPSKMSEKVVIVYFAGISYDDEKKKITFIPGTISLEKLKTITSEGDFLKLPDPKYNLIWINYTLKREVSKLKNGYKRYKRINRLTNISEKNKQNGQMKKLFAAILKLRSNSAKKKIIPDESSEKNATNNNSDSNSLGILGYKTLKNSTGKSGFSFLLPKITENWDKGEKEEEETGRKATLRDRKSINISQERKRRKERLNRLKNERKLKGMISSFNLYNGKSYDKERNRKNLSLSKGRKVSLKKVKKGSFLKINPSPYTFDQKVSKEEVINNCKELFFKIRKKKKKRR